MSNKYYNRPNNLDNNQIITRNKNNIIKNFYDKSSDNINKDQKFVNNEYSESLEKNKIFNSNKNLNSNRNIFQNNFNMINEKGNSSIFNYGDKNSPFNRIDRLGNNSKFNENGSSKNQ